MINEYDNIFIFFFQAEDGIRDIGVTGVQTCALPIFFRKGWIRSRYGSGSAGAGAASAASTTAARVAPLGMATQIGRAACRGRVEISVVAVSFKKKIKLKIVTVHDHHNSQDL